MSRFLYDTVLTLYSVIARIISPFDSKAKLWVKGRDHVWEELKQLESRKARIWFHCSSLGEYEQALPLIDKFQDTFEIVITFFSPSGYEVVKKKTPNLSIFYLPHDSKSNAKQLIESIQPNLAVFVRYDLWYHYLNELKHHQIQTILISAVFRKDNIFFQWYGGLFREMLKCFNHIFVQDEDSKAILAKHGFNNVTKAGDTRIDRVAAIPALAPQFPMIEQFKGTMNLLVVGSLESKDENVILPLVNDPETLNHFKVIIAPHNVSKAHIDQLVKKIRGQVIIHSNATTDNVLDVNLLIIDTIGTLSSIYRYAEIVYIGGGFGEGLHNILEPAVWGKPILIGPKHLKFIEAVELVKRQGAFIINNVEELKKHLLLSLSKSQSTDDSGHAAFEFIKEHRGGTELIFNWITQNQKSGKVV